MSSEFMAATAGYETAFGDWEGAPSSTFHLTEKCRQISDSWKSLQETARQENFLKVLLNHQEEQGALQLQEDPMDSDESQLLFQFGESLKFLHLWYLHAWKRLRPGTHPVAVQDMEHLLHQPHADFSPLSGKCLSLLAALGVHSSGSPRDRMHNFEMVWRFFQNEKILLSADVGIYQDIKSCELSIKIQEDTVKYLPEYSVLKKRAELHIARYHEKYEGQQLQELKQAAALFSQKISCFHLESDLPQEEMQRKRFLAFKTIVERLSKFSDLAKTCRDGLEFFRAIIDDEKMDSDGAFIKAAFNLVSLSFVVINEVIGRRPLPKISVAHLNLESWSAFQGDLKANAKLVRNRLATAANEAATRWLQSEISGYCYDVCQDTAQFDASTRSHLSEIPSQVQSGESAGASVKGGLIGGNATGISRRDHLAVDTHPECHDLIGMRIWHLDAVPTGGFNQFVNVMRPTCGVIIVHVFLRYNIATSRLRDQPEKMQAPGSAGNSFTCGKNGNVQLPSWVQDACVSRLFFQPLLDFLIHDFVHSLNNGEREPARLVFTGSAFDAVLATIVASELLSRFNSYREDNLIRKRHNHGPVDWDVLYNHIRSSIFVLSFMLPAVFSGPHLAPDQLSANRHSVDKDKTQTPFDAIGINMLNISVSNCVAFKLVEHWLSVDRSNLAGDPKQWKSFSKFDLKVIETLQKLLSHSRRVPEIKKSIEQVFSEVRIWAESFESKRSLGTFVADYKSKASSAVSHVKPSIRLINSPYVCQCQTVQEKLQKKSVLNMAGDAAAVLFHGFPQSEEWWFGCLKLVKEPYQLLNCNHQPPSAAHKVMDDIASWFLPVAAVYGSSQLKTPNIFLPHRQSASYGTLNASDVIIPESGYATFSPPKPKDPSSPIEEPTGHLSPRPDDQPTSTPNRTSNLCMDPRFSVKAVGNPDSRRLLIQWNCDSMDSEALIRNCFAVRLTVCFDPARANKESNSDETHEFDFQTEEFSNSDLRVTVSEHDYESLYSLQCETELPFPTSCIGLDVENVIDSAIIFATLRMRFFSAQFGYGHASSGSDKQGSLIHAGLGPELFCFPKRMTSKQPDRDDAMLLLWFWFYLGRCRSLQDAVEHTELRNPAEVALGMIKQHFEMKASIVTIGQHASVEARRSSVARDIYISRDFRKALKLDDVYKRHKFYYDHSPHIANAFDVTFCDFVKQDAEEKSYNSRYRHMRLDELIMQFWDFKLLTLNAFGKFEDLQNCKFDECDAVIQNFDEQSDLLVAKFRDSVSSSKFSKRCQACQDMNKDKKRSSCKRHMYDYLNDDEEGLEYLRKQSSYLRRLSFPKATFKRIVRAFKEQQHKDEHPNQHFYQNIDDYISAIPDPHSLMVKLVSKPSEGNPNSTLMSLRSYDGIFNAFFHPPIESRCILKKDDQRPLLPRFPINLYDNEAFGLDHKQDYGYFPTAVSREGQPAVPACSLISRQSSKLHHFRSIFRVLEDGQQKGWNSQRTEAEFTSWAHGMGVLRSFAIRKEFEAFCGFFKNAKERRPVSSWLRTDSEPADPYLDCLEQIHQIFGDGSDSSNHFKNARDDYYAHEERIISLICRHEKCGYGNRAEFRQEMMHEDGRKAFQQKISFLTRVSFLEKLAFFFCREKSFWASWITMFVCFMSHIHQLRDWLMMNKRCVAAFGDQKVGKSRFWSHSLGIETSPSSQSNTVQTQMWMLPYSQFIDFPAFSEENKLGDSYNVDIFVRCDMLARHIVYDFLLVPDICVYIVKTISPNTESVKKLIAHIRDLETNRYPAFIGTTDDDSNSSGGEFASPLSRNRSGGGVQTLVGNNRLSRESILLCSHTQNFICRLEPVNLGAFSKSLSFDPKLLSVDKGNLTSEHLKEIGRHPELKKSRFVWVCGGAERDTDDQGQAVKIIEKVQVEGRTVWKVVGQESVTARTQSLTVSSSHGQSASHASSIEQSQLMSPLEIWQRLRAKLEKKKRTIGEMFSSKNVYLAYFAEYSTEFNSPFDLDVENHIEQDFPWSSAFCESTGNFQHTALHESAVDAGSSFGDLPILNASQCLELIMRKMLTSDQFDQGRLNDVIGRILVRPMAILKCPDGPDPLTSTKVCDVCTRDDDIDEDERQLASVICNECTLSMCEPHAVLHRKKKGVHNVVKIIDTSAEAKRMADFETALRERDEEERFHPNSYTNRQMRCKIWNFRRQNIDFKGQIIINELCEDSGLIDSLVMSLQELGNQLAFDLSACDASKSSKVSEKYGIGAALWSYFMRDGQQLDGPNVFCTEKIKWRSLGAALKQEAAAKPSRAPRQSRSNLFPHYDLLSDNPTQQFIDDVNMLWQEVKIGGASLKSKISSIQSAVVQESQKTLPSEPSSGVVDAMNLSSGESFARRVVPWFSSLFYGILQDFHLLELNVVADGLFDMLNDPGNANSVTSQEFCLALIKIILLPLLASKKCADHDIRTPLQYSPEFFMSFYYLEKAMFECRHSQISSEPRSLFAWLSFQQASEDQTSRCVQVLSLLLRCITVKGLIELSEPDCLDFQPSIAGLVCENLHVILDESRSAFALQNCLVFSGANNSAKEHSLRSLIANTELVFDHVEQWVLKPMRDIQKRIGQDWRSVSKIASQDNFEKVFEICSSVSEQFGAVTRRMHDLVDGSYAAVTVTIYHKILNDLERYLENPSMFDCPYFDVSLMGRTLMGMKHNDIVRCFLTDPFLCYFECTLHCVSFKSANEIEKNMQFLRLSFENLKNLNIHKLRDCDKFTFIVRNCSTVFFEEKQLEVKNLGKQLIEPSKVIWSDILLPDVESGFHYPQPFYDCSVELSGSADTRGQISAVGLSGCIVGQDVTMNISFRPTEPIRHRTRVLIVLDDAFDYSTRKSPTLTILPLKKEVPYTITEITTDIGKYTLMDVHVNPGDVTCKERITLSFPARNPPGERLHRGRLHPKACFIYLRNHLDQNPGTQTAFFLRSPISFCLGCGIAPSPEIYRMPLQHSEILISNARLGERQVDLMLTFECCIDFSVYEPAFDSVSKSPFIEINLPETWDSIAKDDKPVVFLFETSDGETAHLQVELHEFSHEKISVRIKPEYRGKSSVVLKQGSKCCIVLNGVSLPGRPLSDELNEALVKVIDAKSKLKEASANLKEAVGKFQQDDQKDYEHLKKIADDAESMFRSLKEKLSAGCSVTIKDASQSIVMTGRNVPMSPFFDESQYATVMQRKTFEESEFKQAHDGIGMLPWSSLHEGFFWRKLEEFVQAFVKQQCGSVDIFNSDKYQHAISYYMKSINDALVNHRTQKLTEAILQQLKRQSQSPSQHGMQAAQESNVVSRVAAMAIQLWSSDIALELGNERFSFFKMLNRYTLSEDSKELFERGGINLIKAIKRNIVTDRVQPAMLREEDDGKKGKKSEKEEEEKAIKLFFRGGSVPFEMAGFFIPGKVFRFPVFLASSCRKEVALDFALKVDTQERTLWKISSPDGCMHFKALQENALLPHEEEFLFPPYSAFRVKSNRRETIQHSSKIMHLRIICLEALADNTAPEAQNVPTAPRY